MLDASVLDRRLGFASPSAEIEQECSNIIKTFSYSTDEFCDQWEAFTMANEMEGSTAFTIELLRDFQIYLQKMLERENKKRSALADSNGPSSTIKRKKLMVGRENMSPSSMSNIMATPVRPRRVLGIHSTPGSASSPLRPDLSAMATPSKTPAGSSPVSAFRSDLGALVETLNPEIDVVTRDDGNSRENIRLSMNVSLKKFQYRSMYQKLSEAAEVLDQQIEKMIKIVQDHYKFSDDQLGNPAAINQNEIIAVGRICTEDPTEDKLSAGTVVLETSRKVGSGARIRLNIKGVASYALFNGQIVAVRGTNASGDYFSVTEFLEIPMLPSAAFDSETKNIAHPARRIITASGPYTATNNLDYEPLENLVQHINSEMPHAVILLGPFVDTCHPLVQTGDFEIPGDESGGTLDDLFRLKVSSQLQKIDKSITTILIPNIRDTASNHAAFPQPAFDKASLALPRHVKCLSNPAIFSLDDVVFSTVSVDTIKDILGCLMIKGIDSAEKSKIAFQQMLSQRQLYPVFPSSIPPQDSGITMRSGHSLDTPYWSLSEIHQAVPDVLICPSLTKPTALVTNSVVGLNPGFLAKGNAAGTFASININPPKFTDEENQPHEVGSRVRIDIQKI